MLECNVIKIMFLNIFVMLIEELQCCNVIMFLEHLLNVDILFKKIFINVPVTLIKHETEML